MTYADNLLLDIIPLNFLEGAMMSFDADRAVRENQRLVYRFARKYCRPGVEFLDLVQEGNLGLLMAARKFDEGRQVKFITYAYHWVRAYVQRHARRVLRACADDPEGCHPENDTSSRNLLDNGLMSLPVEKLAAEVESPDVTINFGRLEGVISALPERDMYILLETVVQGRTLEDVGDSLPEAVGCRALTRERVRQIQKSSLETLHKSLTSP